MTTTSRRWRFIAVSALVALALTGCFRNPTAPGLEEAIPDALLAADLGITEAWADNSVDGFSVNVSTGFVMPDGEVTADELRTILGIIVEHANISNIHAVRLTAVVERTTAIDPDDDPPVDIDMRAPAEELGLEWNDARENQLTVGWDDAVTVSTSS